MTREVSLASWAAAPHSTQIGQLELHGGLITSGSVSTHTYTHTHTTHTHTHTRTAVHNRSLKCINKQNKSSPFAQMPKGPNLSKTRTHTHTRHTHTLTHTHLRASRARSATLVDTALLYGTTHLLASHVFFLSLTKTPMPLSSAWSRLGLGLGLGLG